MSSFLKALIIVLAVVAVLVVLFAGAGFFLWKKHGRELIEEGKQTLAEGRETGGRTDNAGCVSETLVRYSQAQGIAGAIKHSLFLRSCLESSSPTPGFCDQVPKSTELMRSARWKLEQCDASGLSGDDGCNQLFEQVQRYCEKDSPR